MSIARARHPHAPASPGVQRAVAKLHAAERQDRPPAPDLSPRSLADYQDRNTICRRLGYGHYGNYLKSATWAAIRRRVLRRDNATCFMCGEKAVLCHHTSYTLAAMEGRDIDGIYAVCWACHTKVHFTPDGGSVELRESGARFGLSFQGDRPQLPDQIGRERSCPCPLKSGPCTLNADRLREGVWYCHLHDPLGKFQRNLSRSRGSGGRRAPDSPAPAPGTSRSDRPEPCPF